jgi:2,3-diketo-5-methylthiopentyl-1-phosphate enolase
MINVFAAGLDALQTLAEDDLGVPILAHTACSEVLTGARESGLGQPVLFGKLARMAGADAIITSTPFAMRPLRSGVFDTTVRWLTEKWGEIRPTMPAPAGGLTAATAVRIAQNLGSDIILGVGGAIQGHPDGAEAGAREVMSAIESAVAPKVS